MCVVCVVVLLSHKIRNSFISFAYIIELFLIHTYILIAAKRSETKNKYQGIQFDLHLRHANLIKGKILI